MCSICGAMVMLTVHAKRESADESTSPSLSSSPRFFVFHRNMEARSLMQMTFFESNSVT